MENNELNFKIINDDIKSLKELLKGRISQLGSFQFSDDSWYFSKRHKDSLPKGNYTITFHQVPEHYKDWVKYYALLCESSTSHTLKKCLQVAKFLKFMDQTYFGLSLEKISRIHLNAYEYHIKILDKSFNQKHAAYASLQDFFMKLTDFEEMPNNVPTKGINPFPQTKNQNKDLLSKKVLQAWDRAMKDEDLNIPLEFRTMYWLIRSFPNRISEVLSMKQNCLKSFYSEYVIQIPTFKQAGGYDIDEPKMIPVIYSGHGKYVIDLVQKLQEQTKQLLLSNSPGETTKTDYLFVVEYWGFNNKNGELSIRYNPRFRQNVRNWTGTHVNKMFKQLAQILDIRDENGILKIPTSHQFRHNAVTDRLYTVGYTVEQVRRLTGHKNEAMTKRYTHQLVEQHKSIHLGISGLRNSHASPVEFRGKILNLDERTTKQLTKDSKRYLTWEANGKKGVGICSDITGCNPKGTSVHFECYACDWFVPKLEYYNDYKAEYAYWKEVIDRTADNAKRAATFENAVRNMSYLERILEICENGIEKFKLNALEDKLNHHIKPPTWERD